MCQCIDVAFGSYENQTEVPIPPHMCAYADKRAEAGLSKTICIDTCILPEIEFLWSQEIMTYGCCCGHNKIPASVIVVYNDIGKMEQLGYAVCYPSHPNASDVFALKSVEAAQEGG